MEKQKAVLQRMNVAVEQDVSYKNNTARSPSEQPSQVANYDEVLGALVGVRASPVSIQEGLSTGDWDVSCQHLERGGFSSSVDSQQAETLAGTMSGGVRQGKQCFTVSLKNRQGKPAWDDISSLQHAGFYNKYHSLTRLMKFTYRLCKYSSAACNWDCSLYCMLDCFDVQQNNKLIYSVCKQNNKTVNQHGRRTGANTKKTKQKNTPKSISSSLCKLLQQTPPLSLCFFSS